MQERNLGDRFGFVFVLSLLLSFVLFPFFISPPDALQEGGGGFVLLSWFFGLGLMFKMFLPAVFFGALSMYTFHSVLDRVLPTWVAFVIACSIAAFLSVVAAYHLDFSMQAPYLDLDNSPGAASFSFALGGFAAFIAFVVALFFCNIGGAA